jgi:acetone carboxylase gamma subunit
MNGLTNDERAVIFEGAVATPDAFERWEAAIVSVVESRVRAAVVAALQQAADEFNTDDCDCGGSLCGPRQNWSLYVRSRLRARAASYVSDTNQE